MSNDREGGKAEFMEQMLATHELVWIGCSSFPFWLNSVQGVTRANLLLQSSAPELEIILLSWLDVHHPPSKTASTTKLWFHIWLPIWLCLQIFPSVLALCPSLLLPKTVTGTDLIYMQSIFKMVNHELLNWWRQVHFLFAQHISEANLRDLPLL